MEDIKWEYCREIVGEDCTDKARMNKMEEILDFANMVFSVAYGSTDFGALLPKAYSSERSSVPIHHMIREEGRIRALIDLYPVELRLQGEQNVLKAAYVGTVSVHPNARGRGYMIELMRRAEEDARRQGCALMILDGERHRYQHYGFERAGIRYSFLIETGNIRHCCAQIYDKADTAFSVYCFEELEQQSPYIDCLFEYYQRRIVTARSREDFWLCLQSYRASAYAILRDGRPVGYVCLAEDGNSVSEIEIDDWWELPRVLQDMMTEFGAEQIHVSAGMDEKDKLVMLEKACDSCSAAMSHQIKLLDSAAVLEFLLNWKQKYDTLVISDYVLGIEEQTGGIEKYLLSVTGDKISVSRTERAADAVFEKLELVRILTTSLCYVEQQKGELNKIKNAPAGWFPLPFYLPEADTF